MRRTTVAAEEDDLAILEYEACRRQISLTAVLREAVAREAATLRAANRPRFGIASSAEGAARLAGDDEAAPVRERSRRDGAAAARERLGRDGAAPVQERPGRFRERPGR
jgi:hypothetical protein